MVPGQDGGKIEMPGGGSGGGSIKF